MRGVHESVARGTLGRTTRRSAWAPGQARRTGGTLFGQGGRAWAPAREWEPVSGAALCPRALFSVPTELSLVSEPSSATPGPLPSTGGGDPDPERAPVRLAT